MKKRESIETRLETMKREIEWAKGLLHHFCLEEADRLKNLSTSIDDIREDFTKRKTGGLVSAEIEILNKMRERLQNKVYYRKAKIEG